VDGWEESVANGRSDQKHDVRLDGQEVLSEWLHRPAGIWLARRLVPTAITANQLTIAGGAVGVVAGGLMWAGAHKPPLLIVGAVVFILACIIDCADGELARARNAQSEWGMMLDGITDNVGGTAVFLAMAYNVVIYTGMPVLWLLGLAAALSAAAHVWLYDARKRQYLTCIGITIDNQPASVLATRRRDAQRAGAIRQSILLAGYEFFRRAQSVGRAETRASDPVLFRNKNRRRMRAWSFLGATTHFVPLYLAALINPIWPASFLACELYYVVVLNGLFLVLLCGQWTKT